MFMGRYVWNHGTSLTPENSRTVLGPLKYVEKQTGKSPYSQYSTLPSGAAEESRKTLPTELIYELNKILKKDTEN